MVEEVELSAQDNEVKQDGQASIEHGDVKVENKTDNDADQRLKDDKDVNTITEERPQRLTCEKCGFQGMTKTKKGFKPWAKAIMCAGILCCICWTPCCCKSSMQTKHWCQGCGEQIAKVGSK